MAIMRLTVNLQKSISPQPNADAVLRITIGLRTGAASKNEIPAESGSPFLKRRRVRGTTPHSQTGKIIPMNAPLIAAAPGRLDTQRLIWSRSTKTSTKPEANVPSKRYGTASTKMPRKTVAKTLSLSHSQVKNPLGSMLDATATSTARRINKITLRGNRLTVVVSTRRL